MLLHVRMSSRCSYDSLHIIRFVSKDCFRVMRKNLSNEYRKTNAWESQKNLEDTLNAYTILSGSQADRLCNS